MATDYTITATEPYTYQSPTRAIVNGYRVYFTIPEFDEVLFVNVPTLDPETVKKAITPVVNNRKALASL